MEPTMYNMLMRLPLFQGMSQEHLFEILEQTTFHFRKVEHQKIAFSQGEWCNQLTFLMAGELTATTQAPCAELSFEETFGPHAVIEPHSLFGKRPTYKATYTARGEVSLLCIDKRHIYTLLHSYEIFRINIINLISSKAEDLHARQWAISPKTLEERFISLIHNLCTTPRGPKTMHAKMEELARLLDCTRLKVSSILNKWEKEDLITMHRKAFVIHDMAKLLEKALHE